MDSSEEQAVPNPPDLPDVPFELLISPNEIRILEEQEQVKQERKAQEQAAAKTASKAHKRRKKHRNKIKVGNVMNIGDRVVIGGRTMLRPGFSLVGLEGLVIPSAPHAPPGCLTVLIDWQSQRYENKDGDLPLLVNIPSAHLEPVETQDEDKTAPDEPQPLRQEPQPSRPVLGLVRPQPTAEEPADEAPANEAPGENVFDEKVEQKPDEQKPDAPDSDEPREEERPRLRLI